jgi:hypothetical protein
MNGEDRMAKVKTLKSSLSSAELCRTNGWGPGTRLVGDEGYGPTVLEITAVGERSILAKAISFNGEPADGYESKWTLDCRDWQPHSSKGVRARR